MNDNDDMAKAAAHWFVELDAAGDDFAAEHEFATWLESDPAHEAAFARCNAAMLLARALKDEVAVARRFEEAARLAADRPRRSARPHTVAWYARPAVAWGVAAVSLVVAVTATLDRGPEPARPTVADSVVANAEQAAPASVEPGRATQQEAAAGLTARAAALMPPVILPGNVVVDARSVAVLPFTSEVADPAQSGRRSMPRETAAAIHREVVRQLSALPGVYAVGNEAVAPYSADAVAIEDIAVQLGVSSIVEASVTFTDGGVSVALRLTDAADGNALIDAAIDRPVERIGEMPNDVATDVAADIATDIAIALQRPTRLTVHQAALP